MMYVAARKEFAYALGGTLGNEKTADAGRPGPGWAERRRHMVDKRLTMVTGGSASVAVGRQESKARTPAELWRAVRIRIAPTHVVAIVSTLVVTLAFVDPMALEVVLPR